MSTVQSQWGEKRTWRGWGKIDANDPEMDMEPLSEGWAEPIESFVSSLGRT